MVLEAKMFNIVESLFVFNNMEKDQNKFYLVSTTVDSSITPIYLLYLGNRLITPLLEVASYNNIGGIKAGDYLSVFPDGSVKVLQADRLTKTVNIGNAEFDGSKDISLHDMGAVRMLRLNVTLVSSNWIASGDANYPFKYIIDIKDKGINSETYGSLQLGDVTKNVEESVSSYDIQIHDVSDTEIILYSTIKPAINVPVYFVYFIE